MDTPRKTPADYLLEAICPALIILLVGSLAFFLIQVFYRGDLIQGVRWTMFWFVLAIVLVSRVGIQQGRRHALFYGIALAVATWIYLVYTHKVPVIGAVLLAVTWWCAHLLTVDCTVLREEDEPGQGTLETLLSQFQLEKPLLPREPIIPPTLAPLDLLVAADLARRRNRKRSRPPGRSVVFFSLAALPLFGVGQLFLPNDNEPARHAGFAFLALYLAAAFGLLVTTSYLGLHRQLRRRAIEIPAGVAVAWVRFGVIVAAGVLLLALVLPRPGGYSIWQKLTYHIPHKEHKASPQAPPFNPPGKDEGAPTSQPIEQPDSSANTKTTPSGSGTQPSRNSSPSHSTSRIPSNQPGSDGSGGGGGSGDQGSDGQTGQNGQGGTGADDSSPPHRTVHVKVKTPNGSGDSSNGQGDSGPDSSDPKVPTDSGKGNVQVDSSDDHSKPSKSPKPKETKNSEQKQIKLPEQPPPPPEKQGQGQPQPNDWLRRLLRWLAIIAGALVLLWLLVRFRRPIARAIRAFFEAVANFFRKLFGLRIRRRRPTSNAEEIIAPMPILEDFAAYQNPFVTGKYRTWPRERLLLYTYEAMQAWAKEQGIVLLPQQTPREFCSRLIEQFPDIGPELERFSVYYTHAAFAKRLPDDFEIEIVRRLWQHLGDTVAMATR